MCQSVLFISLERYSSWWFILYIWRRSAQRNQLSFPVDEVEICRPDVFLKPCWGVCGSATRWHCSTQFLKHKPQISFFSWSHPGVIRNDLLLTEYLHSSIRDVFFFTPSLFQGNCWISAGSFSMQWRFSSNEAKVWIWWTSKWGVKLDQTYPRQSALISQSPLWYPALGKPPLHLVALKQKRQEGFTTLSPSLHCPSFSFFTHTHTYTFTIHTHTGLSFESLGLDLKFLFRACHAFYMHGEWERRGGIAWSSSPNELPSADVGLLRDVSTHTHTHTTTFFHSPNFLAPAQLFQH